MLKKQMDAVKANRQYQQVKTHVVDNKDRYMIGVGCLAGGYFLRARSAEITQIVKPKNVMGLGYKSPQIMNTIVLPAKGDPGDVVQNLRTLETYASKGELARALGVPRSMVTRYFNGALPNLLDDQFDVIGKAGHPIPIA